MDNWTLKPCSDINRMLKIRTDLNSFENEKYPHLVTITHRYATSDDVLFPEPTTLAFFSGFEERSLYNLTDAVYVAQDIHTGLFEVHIYAKDYEKTIHQTIEYLKLKPEYHVEFKVTSDKNWAIITSLGE
ncbi:MAG: DUF695 domain-containing protein [Campylobacterota bacterium]|nr:DUF695 domain-containing protein [Campylobacterota bacterium]